jgi:hypothetical protein
MNPDHHPGISASAPGSRPPDRRALGMSVCAGMFLLRVIGQVLVTYRKVKWLPSVEHWQSGLLPYPVLLGAQAAILGTMTAMIRAVWRGEGWFARPRPRAGRRLMIFGRIYFTSMIVRYAITMAVRPQWRWFGHTIPMFFHCVLATYLMLYAGFLRRRQPPDDAEAT